MAQVNKTLEEMATDLTNIGFFIGGLSDEGIKYYYQKMVSLGKI